MTELLPVIGRGINVDDEGNPTEKTLLVKTEFLTVISMTGSVLNITRSGLPEMAADRISGIFRYPE